MKIVSFDVGIKNLAYCLINKIDDDNFTIDDWGIINLDDDRKMCTFVMRNKKVCSRPAYYNYNDNESNIKYLCKAHKKSHIIEDIEVKICNSGEICCFKNDKTICNKQAVETIKSNNYCNTHLKSIKKQILKDVCPKKMAKHNCNKLKIQVLATKLFKKLDENPKLLMVDEILIENQPSFINPTMKTISSFLYAYFSMRGIVDVNKTNSSISAINFFSPSNKLKINKVQSDKIIKKGENKQEIYSITKELGESYCKAIINKERLEFLNKFDKKDDLCDSFLQGFFYLFCRENVPKKYTQILEKVASEVDNKQIDKKKKKLSGLVVKTDDDPVK